MSNYVDRSVNDETITLSHLTRTGKSVGNSLPSSGGYNSRSQPSKKTPTEASTENVYSSVVVTSRALSLVLQIETMLSLVR